MSDQVSKYLIFIILLFIPFYSFTFPEVEDITNNAIDTISDNKQKVEYLINLAESVSHANPSDAFQIINTAECYLDEDDSILKFKTGNIKGRLSILDKDYSLAIDYYRKLISKNNTPVVNAEIMANIAECYLLDNNIDKAKLFVNSAYIEALNSGDTKAIISTLTVFGNYFIETKNYQAADTCFSKALDISKNYRDKELIAEAGYNICKIKILLDAPDIDSLINKYGSVECNSQTYPAKVSMYSLASAYYAKIGNFNASIDNLQKAVTILDIVKNNHLETYKNSVFYIHDNHSNNNSNFLNVLIWILLGIVFIILIFLIRKNLNKRKALEINLEKTVKELKEFDRITPEINSEIEKRTQQRLNDIKQELGQNTNTEIALRETIQNLYQVNYLKDIFLSKLSHDIRTPLNGILGFSSLLESELALMEDKSLYEFANNISESGSGLVNLLNNLLDISCLDSDSFDLNIKTYNTNELIQNVVDKYSSEARTQNLKLFFDEKQVPDINTDNTIFTKILTQIIENSIKFTEKGFIKVSNNFEEENKLLNIIIVDTGVGIDKAYIKQVFEPYRQESLGYSTTYQGTGLGLPLVLKMTEKLGGTLDIESEKGKGTTIKISLPFDEHEENIPVIEKESPAVEKVVPVTEPEKKSLPWDGLSILLVEDDNFNQILYRKLLKSSGHLSVAGDGKAALSIIENMDSSAPYQLVLMDINLPGKYDGIGLMKEIRKQWPDFKDIPFIAQTAFAISGNRESMLEEGFDEYITKPILKSTLAEVIAKVVKK